MSSEPNIVSINCDEGKKRLANARSNKSFHEWIEFTFGKQKHCSGCGLRTVAILLTAAEYARSELTKSKISNIDHPFTEKGLIESQNFKSISGSDKLGEVGTTLDEVCHLMQSFGFEVESFKSSETSLEEFRAKLTKVCKNPKSLMGVNYCLKSLNFRLTKGHHSPIAGYDDESDSVLIMDTWPEHGEYWVETKALWESMDTLDKDCGERRGFYIVHSKS